jgi:hypothetical protein
MPVYFGERDRDQPTVLVVHAAPSPTTEEVGELLADIRRLSDEAGGLGRPHPEWDQVMARKRDVIARIEAAEVPDKEPLPDPFGGPSGLFDWTTSVGAARLAAAILTIELGETPPAVIFVPFAADVIAAVPDDKFQLDRDEIWTWIETHRELIENELYLEPPPPACAVVTTPPHLVGDETVAPATASALVEACEQAWSAIQYHHPELPDAVIVLGSGIERGRLVKLGHWWGGRWIADGQLRGEVLLAGEALHLPPDQVFEVLLHEAAHGLNAARGIKDTSRGGRYHNARFAQAAAEVGLVASNMPPYGLASTQLADTGKERYAETISQLGEAMRIARHVDRGVGIGAEAGSGTETGTSADEDGGPGGGRTKVQPAQCGCGRRLRMAPTVLAAGPVICGVCDTEFTITPSRSAEREPHADAVVDRTFLERRHAAIAAEPGARAGEHLTAVLERERAKLDAALAITDNTNEAVLASLRQRRHRIERLLSDTARPLDSIGTNAATEVQADGIRRLLSVGTEMDARVTDWYERFATADETPIAVATEDARRSHVELARSMLKADGTLTGPAVRIEENEFMAGDRLVVEAGDGDHALPVGALGTVERVDPAAGELRVDFATLGRIRISLRDAVVQHIRHDYAEVTGDAPAWQSEALRREAQRAALATEP